MTERSAPLASQPLRVLHLLDALTDTGPGLWGKERLIFHLMAAQRRSGDVEPALATFSPCSLADVVRAQGFEVHTLDTRHRRVPVGATARLRHILRASSAADIVHSHEYKANLVARLLRHTGGRMRALVSTSHAWFDESPALRAYNELDRRSAFLSDLTTVADERMLAQFPKRGELAYVANGLPDRDPGERNSRQRLRAQLNVAPDSVAVGFLARLSVAKGIPEFLDAARRSADLPIVWVIGGKGPLEATVVQARLPNVRYVGYVDDTDTFREALDVYVQASHIEGLSLSLLEAMRAGLAIVATDAGSTLRAVRDGVEALVVRPGDADGLRDAVVAVAGDARMAARLGAAARERFTRDFPIEGQQAAFLSLYRACLSRRGDLDRGATSGA